MRPIYAAVALILLSAPLLRAQDGPITTLTLQTRVVSISAYVRDKQGRPVGGLSPADFKLKQDGFRRKSATFPRVRTCPSPSR